ncbi:MAG TPA: hypothetical protein VI172_07885 [Candidatus Dormibacteraeota bacterium]|jgi:hypothetical protein
MPSSDVAQVLLLGRQLVLQSKRLLLASNERRFRVREGEGLREAGERLRGEVDGAQSAYRSALVKLGSPSTPGYWPAAYSHLIERADHLSGRLKSAAADTPHAGRYEIAVEVELLDELIDEWRDSLRTSILEATA